MIRATQPVRHLGVYSATDFGAVGDGVHKDTDALQQAIDLCSRNGGGQVLIPSGCYQTGTLYLRDNVELHLCAGAVLVGSADRADYNSDDQFAESKPFTREKVTGAHLLIGYDVKNIAITGHGTINGNSPAFFENPEPEDSEDAGYRSSHWRAKLKSWRPGQMIWLCRCRNVAVQDVCLRNSTYWSLMLYGCDNVRIRSLNITNLPSTPNGDGVDIDSSRHVTVSDCIIRTADDCITLRAHSANLGEERPCENVTVTNCVLSTPANCLRIGVGDGTIRNCNFSNLIFSNSRVGINMTSRFPGMGTRGTLIENIMFSNIAMDTILALQALHGEGTGKDAGFHNITFSNIRAQTTAGAYIAGNSDNYARNVNFQHVDFHVHNETVSSEYVDRVRFPDPVPGCEGVDGERAIPAALYARHVDGIHAHQVHVHKVEPLQRNWLHALWFERCRNVDGPERVDFPR